MYGPLTGSIVVHAGDRDGRQSKKPRYQRPSDAWNNSYRARRKKRSAAPTETVELSVSLSGMSQPDEASPTVDVNPLVVGQAAKPVAPADSCAESHLSSDALALVSASYTKTESPFFGAEIHDVRPVFVDSTSGGTVTERRLMLMVHTVATPVTNRNSMNVRPIE